MPVRINETESNNSFQTANSSGIIFGGPTNSIISGALTSSDLDNYKVYANAGTRIVARTLSYKAISELDPVIEIYSNSGTLLTTSDDFDEGFDGYINYNITTSSDYFIRVRGYTTSEVGSYQLYISNTAISPASSGADTIFGTNLSDVIVGGSGNDSLIGGSGDDIFDAGSGSDTISGDAGDDIFLQRGDASISSLDQYFGGSDRDQFLQYPNIFRSNNFSFEGGASYGYSGKTFTKHQYSDTNVSNNAVLDSVEVIDVSGGSLNDTIYVGNLTGTSLGVSDSLIIFRAEAGNDYLDGSSSITKLIGFGDGGADTLIGGSADDNLFGGAGNDILLGGVGNDGLSGDDGDDRINAGDGNDLILGGAGNDELGGGTGNDTILGQDGNDTLFGESGDDRMNGGADADILVGGTGNDELGGGSGDDILVGNEDNDTLFGEDGNDRLSGGDGADTLIGGLGNDELGGDAGDDVMVGNDGADTLFGGAGSDRLNGGSEADILLGNEGADELGGGTGNDVLSGGDGADVLFGEDGNDTLDGGTGNDILIGGSNADQYNFGGNSGADIINGFNASEGDRLALFGQSYVLGQDQFGNALLNLSGGGSVALSNITPGQVNASFFA